MWARLTRYEGSPEGIATGIALYREQVLPWLRNATGFRGWVVMIDPDGTKTTSITFWADEATMRDEHAGGNVLRDEVAANVDIEMTSLEFLDLAVAESIHLDT